jgi:DNA-binding CsgD family transcriptional regulator
LKGKPPPEELKVVVVETGGARYAVLSYPLPTVERCKLLTRAERDVLALLLSGLSNAEIARQRRTSVRTVANQVASIFDKLGVSSRSELAALMATGN